MFILPSRSRPNFILEFIECCKNTNFSSPITILVDDDDPRIDEYKAINYPKNWIVLYNESAQPVIKNNNWLKDNMHHDFYGVLADDLRPKTIDWDKKLVEVAKNNQIAYPNDTIQCEKLCTHSVIGGDLIRATGWIGNPELIHFYGDDVWMHIGRQTNKLHYLGDVICQHLHPSVGTREADEISLGLEKNFAEDYQIYTRWLNNPQTAELIEKIKAI
jgi:hypothetical protein